MLTTLLMTVGTTAHGGPGSSDPFGGDLNLEAQGICTSQNCLGTQIDPGLSKLDGQVKGLSSQVHRFAIFDSDDRRPADLNVLDPELRSVGRIKTLSPVVVKPERVVDGVKFAALSAQTQSSGVMISACHVLTTFHSVFGNINEDQIAKGQAPNVTFTVNGREYPAEVYRRGRGGDHAGEDWTILRLPDCPGLDPNVGWMDLNQDPEILTKTDLKSAGFPSDRQGLTVDPKCRISEVLPGSFYTAVALNSCASIPGDSGGAIFYIGDDKRPKLVAIHSGGSESTGALLNSKGDRSRLNFAVVPEFNKKIALQLDVERTLEKIGKSLPSR